MIILLCMLGLSACIVAGARHGLSDTVGMSAQELEKRFGAPAQIEKAPDGTQAWIYSMAGGKKKWRYVIGTDGKVVERK